MSRDVIPVTFARLMRSTVVVPGSRCWIYTGSAVDGRRNYTGPYGKITYWCKRRKAHRSAYVHLISYQLFKGKIKRGREIHHDCRRGRCWNPEHLYMVTPSVNALEREKDKRARRSGSALSEHWSGVTSDVPF